jgi:hypothetical protein
MIYEFFTTKDRAEFIRETPTTVLRGFDENGDDMIIQNTQGVGMVLKIRRAAKPRWWECSTYDDGGHRVNLEFEQWHA